LRTYDESFEFPEVFYGVLLLLEEGFLTLLHYPHTLRREGGGEREGEGGGEDEGEGVGEDEDEGDGDGGGDGDGVGGGDGNGDVGGGYYNHNDVRMVFFCSSRKGFSPLQTGGDGEGEGEGDGDAGDDVSDNVELTHTHTHPLIVPLHVCQFLVHRFHLL
jgi:hypothetical protein